MCLKSSDSHAIERFLHALLLLIPSLHWIGGNGVSGALATRPVSLRHADGSVVSYNNYWKQLANDRDRKEFGIQII